MKTRWKNSPTHNENLLMPQFTEVGFGVCKSPKYIGGDPFSKDKPAVIVVQHFARPYGQ